MPGMRFGCLLQGLLASRGRGHALVAPTGMRFWCLLTGVGTTSRSFRDFLACLWRLLPCACGARRARPYPKACSCPSLRASPIRVAYRCAVPQGLPVSVSFHCPARRPRAGPGRRRLGRRGPAPAGCRTLMDDAWPIASSVAWPIASSVRRHVADVAHLSVPSFASGVMKDTELQVLSDLSLLLPPAPVPTLAPPPPSSSRPPPLPPRRHDPLPAGPREAVAHVASHDRTPRPAHAAGTRPEAG